MSAKQTAVGAFSVRAVAYWCVAIGIFLIALVYHETLRSMVVVWTNSKTFNHCFLIAPISGWLIWRRRTLLAEIPVANFWPGLVFLSGASLLWLLGALTDVSLAKHLAITAMIPGLVLTVLGYQFAWAIAFPLAYLFFLVPFGEWAVPYLMDFTAEFSVMALKLTGIPVLSEGMYITIPNGNFRVVEACAGVRFLIASVALGTLYAYLTYSSFKKRIIFIIAALVFPILANGLRAYGIILIGHFSDMKLATGADHLIYGWVFFGIVMFIMFWVGSHWADTADPDITSEPTLPFARDPKQSKSMKSGAVTAAALLLVLSPAALIQASGFSGGQVAGNLIIIMPPGAKGWGGPIESQDDWAPVYPGAATSLRVAYENNGQVIEVAIVAYLDESQGSELVSHANRPYDGENWHGFKRQRIVADIAGRSATIKETLISSGERRRVVWEWYRIADFQTARAPVAKLLQGWQRLVGSNEPSMAIMSVAEYDSEPDQARERLGRFLASVNLSPETGFEP